jgi:hypothetical protein
MQMIFIVAVVLAFAAVWFLGKYLMRVADAHEVINHARNVEREAKRKEEAMRRYAMTDLRPARKS